MSRKCAKGYRDGFRPGECVPAAAMMEENTIIEVFCQNCVRPMTQREHKEYFDKYIPWFEQKFNCEYQKKTRPHYDFRDEEQRTPA